MTRKKILIKKNIVYLHNLERCTMNCKVIVGQVLVSVCYIGLLLMFAYTSLFYEVIMKNNQAFLSVFNSAQSTWSGFIVNIGLLLMLLIDYGYDKKYIPRWALMLSILAFSIIALVYYFAGHETQVMTYNSPFNWPWFGMLLYGMFVVYLIVIKYCSLPHVNLVNKIAESYKKIE